MEKSKSEEIKNINAIDSDDDIIDDKVVLTTVQNEMVRAITNKDYAYFEDLGGLEQNINFRISPDGINPLLLAASIGDVPLMQMLLANQNIRLNHTDFKGENACFYATSGGHIKAVKELQKRGCFLQISKVTGKHPAHTAWANGHSDLIQYFIEEVELDPNIKKKDGLTMLMIACINNHPDIVKILLENRANPDATLENGVTALYLAAKYGSHISIDFLLQVTKNIDDICDNSKSTPLMAAVYNGHLQWTRKLLIKRANPDILNANGEDVYVLASMCSNVEVLKLIVTLFIAKGNDIDKESPLDKMSMFMRAVYVGNFKNAKHFKRKGAQVNFTNSEGDSILHIALRK